MISIAALDRKRDVIVLHSDHWLVRKTCPNATRELIVSIGSQTEKPKSSAITITALDALQDYDLRIGRNA